MGKIINSVILSGLFLSCAMTSFAADPYKVRVPLSDDDNGATVYIVNFDNSAKIDSVTVADKTALFKGQIDEPVMAAVVMDGQPLAHFILEPGSIVVDPAKRKAFGSMLNDQLAEFINKMNELAKSVNTEQNDDLRQDFYNRYLNLRVETMLDNIDNPLGYYIFVNIAPDFEQTEFDEYLTKYPVMANYERVKKYKAIFEHKNATAVGKKFTDFSVTYDGKTERLSDYVGKGKYVLVDFWASWCGPCLRQIPVIKELLEQFGDKGLEALGVAVWDEPAATEAAIKSHGITWPCIIDAQRIPSDAYGFNAIPCIILFGPDGTILSRDKQGDELKADVSKAILGQ